MSGSSTLPVPAPLPGATVQPQVPLGLCMRLVCLKEEEANGVGAINREQASASGVRSNSRRRRKDVLVPRLAVDGAPNAVGGQDLDSENDVNANEGGA